MASVNKSATYSAYIALVRKYPDMRPGQACAHIAHVLGLTTHQVLSIVAEVTHEHMKQGEVE